MGNVVRFQMHARHAVTNTANGEGLEDKAPPQLRRPGEDNLFATLSYVRDRLSGGAEAFDLDARHACLRAMDRALETAVAMESTIVEQTLHIEEMARVACTDPLTGVYNRRGFEQEFNRALAAATRFQETGVLVYIDLDGFKPINDTYGHAAGDLVLAEVARMLCGHVRPQDLVARIGGDEFTVLLTRTSWEDGLKRAEAIQHLLNTMYVGWRGKNIAVRASLGFQRFGADGDAEHLLGQADHAMYEAKRLRGRERKPEA